MTQFETARSALVWRATAFIFSIPFLSACANGFETSKIQSPQSSESQTAIPADQTPPSPPPTENLRDAYTNIIATSYDLQSGSELEDAHVAHLDDGDYLGFRSIDFGTPGAKSVVLQVAVPDSQAGQIIEIRLGGVTGQLIGALTVKNTGGWFTFQPQTAGLSATPSGVNDLFLVMKGSKGVANLKGFFFSKDPPIAPPPIISNWVDTLIDDMKLFHDAPVRTLQWLRGWGSGFNMPDSFPKPPSGFTHAQPWGVITADYGGSVGVPPSPWRVPGPYTGNRAPNTRAQVRDLQLWWLTSSGKWVLGSHTNAPGGQMYHSSWRDDQTSSQNAFQDEPNNGGGTSAGYINLSADGLNLDEFLWHFYGPRAQVPSDYIGFASAYFSRLILRDPSGPDDRAKAHLLADTAGDWWLSATASWDNFKTNGPMGYNRFKYLTNEWQLIGFYSNSLTESQIRANPPPFIGR